MDWITPWESKITYLGLLLNSEILHMFTSSHFWPTVWAIRIQPRMSHPTSVRPISIFPKLRLGLPRCLFRTGFLTNISYAFVISFISSTYLAHCTVSDSINLFNLFSSLSYSFISKESSLFVKLIILYITDLHNEYLNTSQIKIRIYRINLSSLIAAFVVTAQITKQYRALHQSVSHRDPFRVLQVVRLKHGNFKLHNEQSKPNVWNVHITIRACDKYFENLVKIK
jgi:hypothetical protein